MKDPLTGLLKHRGFKNAVAYLGAESAALAGAAVLMIDIDQFKQINDSHGHLGGDQVLRAVSQVLRARTKVAACRQVSTALNRTRGYRALQRAARWSRGGFLANQLGSLGFGACGRRLSG